MKKYVKPELYFERFELSQQIAACDFKGNANGTYTGVDDYMGTITIFTASCGLDGSFSVESFCYHNSSSSPYGIFNS